jgi:hypothetical protein
MGTTVTDGSTMSGEREIGELETVGPLYLGCHRGRPWRHAWVSSTGPHGGRPRQAPTPAARWPVASCRSCTTRAWRSTRWCGSRCVRCVTVNPLFVDGHGVSDPFSHTVRCRRTGCARRAGCGRDPTSCVPSLPASLPRGRAARVACAVAAALHALLAPSRPLVVALGTAFANDAEVVTRMRGCGSPASRTRAAWGEQGRGGG